MQVFDHDEVRDHRDEREYPEHEHDDLGVHVDIEQRHHDKDQHRQREDENPAHTDEARIVAVEPIGARKQLRAVRVGVEEHFDHRAQPVARAGQVVLLAHHDIRFGELAIEQEVQVQQVRSRHEPDEQRHRQE